MDQSKDSQERTPPLLPLHTPPRITTPSLEARTMALLEFDQQLGFRGGEYATFLDESLRFARKKAIYWLKSV